MRYARLAVAGALLVGLAFAPAGRVLAGPKDGDPAEAVVIDLGGESLRLVVPDFPDLKRRTGGEDRLKAWWTGTVDASELVLEVWVYDNRNEVFDSPQAVSAFVASVFRDPKYSGDEAFAFAKVELVKGKFGPSSSATLGAGPVPSAKAPTGEVIVLGGVLASHAYQVRARATPALEGGSRDRLMAFLRQGVTATYPAVDLKWTADDAKRRWEQSVDDPRERAALKPVVRTKHYVILTDSGAGPLFAKKMEACYDQIQRTYPFDEVDGVRLLPVFLFKDDTEYVRFSVKVSGMTEPEAHGTKGHAWHDFYATYYDSPNDPVHIHEATHQLFRNRLHLAGGGSWFQEGLAEYMCTLPGDRKGFARNAARSGRFAPFRAFVRSRDIIGGVGGLDGGAAYSQAASLIEFLHDGKFHPDKFQAFVHEIGGVDREDEAAIDAKVKEIYGVDLDGLEKEWVKYWTAK